MEEIESRNGRKWMPMAVDTCSPKMTYPGIWFDDFGDEFGANLLRYDMKEGAEIVANGHGELFGKYGSEALARGECVKIKGLRVVPIMLRLRMPEKPDGQSFWMHAICPEFEETLKDQSYRECPLLDFQGNEVRIDPCILAYFRTMGFNGAVILDPEVIIRTFFDHEAMKRRGHHSS